MKKNKLTRRNIITKGGEGDIKLFGGNNSEMGFEFQ